MTSGERLKDSVFAIDGGWLCYLICEPLAFADDVRGRSFVGGVALDRIKPIFDFQRNEDREGF